MENTEQNLVDEAKVRDLWVDSNAIKIETKEQLDEYIQVTKETNGNDLFITTKAIDNSSNTVMLFDNSDINSAFLHSELTKFQENLVDYQTANSIYDISEEQYNDLKADIETVRITYCNNNELIDTTFADLFKAITHLNEFKPPVLAFYNKNVSEAILLEFEVFEEINHFSFLNIFMIINNQNYFIEEHGTK